MAARLNNWNFYVYELSSNDGLVKYIGKGSGRRLEVQKRKFNLNGVEVARFKRECDAYSYEVERISWVNPELNKCKGGNGNTVAKKAQPRLSAWEKAVNAIGTRAYAARLWLAYAPAYLRDKSTVDKIRLAAYG